MRFRLRVCMWTALGSFIAVCFLCTAVAFWFEVRKHDLAGVPWNHFALRLRGQPVYVPRGGRMEERPQVPLTEEQFRVWEDNDRAGRGWARCAAACAAAIMALILGLRVSRKPTGAAPSQPLQPAGPP